MRPIWNGMISFGLVNIPIGLFTAVNDRPFQFHFLHEKDDGRIRNKRVCEECGAEVSYKDLVRGFEYEKGEYIVLTDKDLIALLWNRTNTSRLPSLSVRMRSIPCFLTGPTI